MAGTVAMAATSGGTASPYLTWGLALTVVASLLLMLTVPQWLPLIVPGFAAKGLIGDAIGLTEALALKAEALAQGYDIMVGCMVGSSLAMAPATILAQGAALTDLDGPLLLGEDRDEPLHFDQQGVHPSDPKLWG